MKKVLTYSAIVLLLGFTACNKTDNINLGSDDIRFAPASVETRALIEDADDLPSQTFQVYDYLTNGTTTTEHINNTIVYDEASTSWTYGTAATYKWDEGTHKFFGYTADAGSFASNKLTVSKALTYEDADLLYSEVYSTTAADWKANKTAADVVPLSFKHLFAAVSINVKNEMDATTNSVSVSSLGTSGIRNSGSADVDYSGDAVSVSYGTLSQSGSYGAAAFSSAIALGENEMIDVFSQAKTTAKNFYVIWPQAFQNDGDLTVNVSYTMTVDGESTPFTKGVQIPATAWEAGKKYSYTLRLLPTGVKLEFIVADWEEGQAGSIRTDTGSINMSNVTWMNSKVKLTADAENTVNTVNNGAYSVTMYYKPYVEYVDEFGTTTYTQATGFHRAQAYFTINYPLSGKFKIGLIPAYGQTEDDLKKDMFEIYVYKQTGTQIVEGKEVPVFEWVKDTENDGHYVGDIPTDHSTIYFQVRASEAVENAATNPEYRAQIDIWINPDGDTYADDVYDENGELIHAKGSNKDEWISAYSEVRANYATVIPARN